MPSEYYRDALKRAQKEFRSCTAKGEYPYLPVLDEFVSQEDLLRTVDLGDRKSTRLNSSHQI